MNIEDDEAGKLAGFRSRFGRAWDSEGAADVDEKVYSSALRYIALRGRMVLIHDRFLRETETL